MQKIIPCLWYDSEAEEAANYYIETFNNSPYPKGESKILSKTLYNTDTPSDKPIGSVLTVNFSLAGQEFTALNGGSFFKLNEAVSFMITCRDQAEIDFFWEKLSAVPESEQCGWLKDKFGLSWQIIPEGMDELVKDEKAMKALLEMKKLDIAKLKEAAGF